ncbi:MAG: hypothetical protein RL272_407 [Candidatus Parcubacteria bacterium]
MIEEELAKGGGSESEGAKPIEVRGGAIESGREPERAASPEAAKADSGKKKDVWEKERKALADSYERLHAERKERPKEPKDALTEAELDEFRAVIAQAAKENDKIATSVLKEGIAVADEATLHPYDKGLDSLTDKLLEPNGDFYRQALMLMNSQPDGGEAMKALTRKLQERVETLAKATEQKKRLGASRAETTGPAAQKEARAAKPKELSPDEKKRAVSEAMKPFAEDVARMLQGDKLRKDREEAEKKAANDDKEGKKPSFWDKLFGKKAA